MTSIPLADLSNLGTNETREGLVSLSESIQKLGFLTLKSPSTPSKEQIENIFRISQRFFEEETDENKEAVSITVGNKGWVKRRQEA
ncbi:uncharacterized protein EI90DRAFT_2444404 [Cantharellus anzutake]|uniref:uncharacterized protein n=1 Tax=Cantharellus anzutake TaxID=1750568 RepID=UPI001906B81B|nr:uncharacterized protein EI90DRAFT_2444404 [Cantharellus anzutake]KAF8339031.1 hypothetical protein EI90DRAFT_2444404 [Cantharellus anzutake]